MSALAVERQVMVVSLAAILLTAVIGATLIANRQTIGRPLELLLQSINETRLQGRPRHVDWNSSDEIGQVVSAFNELQERQDANEQELRKSRDELELRVEERTVDLVQAEAEARTARRQLSDAIESISDGFAIYDSDDRLLIANRKYREVMLGGEDVALPADAQFRDVIQKASLTGNFPDADADPQAWADVQMSRRADTSEPIIQELKGNHWQQVRNERTDQGGIVAVRSDITEIKRISDELQRAKNEAEAANEAKSAFLATMSHEIRTPLNGIVGMSNLLLGTNLDGEQREFTNTVVAASDSLLTIINDILDFSKVEAGALELERIPMDLWEAVEGSAELVATKAADKAIELACRIDPDVPQGLYGDPTRLRQICLNLLNNAIKFTDVGEVVIKLSLAASDSPSQIGDNVLLKITVTDTGIGIPVDRMDRLFKSFSQVDASTTRRFGGTGLGLVITKRLVELMGGEITVESEQGKGTVFGFTLPGVVAPPPARADRRDQLAGIKGKRVLVVDDNRTNRLIVGEKLRSWELEAHTVEGASEAMAWLESGEDVDACVIDYKMPGTNGFELSRQIRELKSTNAPPLILFTSVTSTETEFRENVEAIGFAAVVTKPAKSGHLLNALATAMLEQSHDDEPDQVEKAPKIEQSSMSILVVDDNLINRKVASKVLGRLGYKPDVVKSGIEAVEQCNQKDYDVVLMDIEMPDMDGITATGRIREELPAERHPYIVALTANAMASERDRYLNSGMDDYLSKPIDVDLLAKALDVAADFRLRQETSVEVSNDKNQG